MSKKNLEHKTIEETATDLTIAYTTGMLDFPDFLRAFSLDCAKYSKYNSNNRKKYTEIVIDIWRIQKGYKE